MTTGYFSVDAATRTAKGVLLPYGVKSKGISASNTKPITFTKGSVSIPRDPMVIGLNDEHERFKVLGRATRVEETDEGIYAEFTLADTDEADAWLSEHTEGAYFSAEIDGLRRMPNDYGTGRLAGAAVTLDPAFDGTGVALFSLIGDEQEEEETPDPAPAEEEDEQDEEPAENEEEDMADAVAPTQALLSRRPKAEAPRLTKQGFFSALHESRRTGDASALRPYAEEAEKIGLFALSDITFDDAAGLETLAGIPNQWLGHLWQGRRFERRVVPLLTQGTLTSTTATGWVWTTKPAVAAWAGNKTDVPSNAPVVGPKAFTAQRFAGGHDLAREYFDFNVTEIIESYVEAMVDSYAVLSDGHALTRLVAEATAFTPAATTVNKGLLAVVDGALTVIAAQANPSFALVAPNIYRDIIDTPHSDALEFLNASLGLEGGSTSGFRIQPDSRLAAGQVVVGAKEAAAAWELPGSPIRVSIPDLVKGGIDEAFFGYIAAGVTYPAAVVKATVTLP